MWARVIAGSEYSTLIHLVILLGTILVLAGLVAIRHAIEGAYPKRSPDWVFTPMSYC